MERFWQVRETGVVPVWYNPDDLKNDTAWLCNSWYDGHFVFENFSRAQLCWFDCKDYIKDEVQV